MIERTIQRFEETGIRNCSKSDRLATATNENKVLDVLQSFVEDPHTFINCVAQQHEIGAASVHKILKKKNSIYTNSIWSKNYLRIILIDACNFAILLWK